MQFGSRRADLLERSLQGQKCTDQEVLELVATVGLIAPLTSRAGAPQPEFVSALGIRLRAEALALPARESRTTQESIRFPSPIESRRSAVPPRVFAVGRGLPRVLAGATASLLLVGGIVGGASRSALPGGLLYPVKQLLDSTAVQLASSDFDRGMTLLSQAQEHISDARALVDRDGAEADPASVDEALVNAHDAVSSGQRTLLAEFDRTGNPQALIALQDFVSRALPQLHALRPLVPADTRPDVDAVIMLLQDIRTRLTRRVALCGQPCAFMDSTARAGSSTFAPPTGLPSTLAPGGGTGVTLPTAPVPLVTLAPIPGVTASVPATSVPLVTLVPIPGISTSVPSLPVPLVTLAPIPGVISVPLP
jgi:hypothetical protein